MSISIEKRWLGGVLAVLTAFVLFAASAAEKAGATEVTPGNADATAELKMGQLSWFIPDNAYFPLAIGCTQSAANFRIPPAVAWPAGLDLNKNRPNVGALSWDHGGVIANVDGSPTFGTCNVFGPYWDPQTQDPEDADIPIKEGPIQEGFDVDVTTFGDWTVTAFRDDKSDPHVSIAVPPSGALIEIIVPMAGSCFLDVAPDKPQSVFAYFENGTTDPETASTMHVDSQILFSVESGAAICAAFGFQTTSPHKEDYGVAQFEALYDVHVAGAPVLINP